MQNMTNKTLVRIRVWVRAWIYDNTKLLPEEALQHQITHRVTVEGASMVKLGNSVFGEQIQVPDVHSFTMSQTRKSRFRRVFLHL